MIDEFHNCHMGCVKCAGSEDSFGRNNAPDIGGEWRRTTIGMGTFPEPTEEDKERVRAFYASIPQFLADLDARYPRPKGDA